MPSGPTSIGPYRIERELARGGMGIVYLAHDTRLHRRVAIKALPDSVASDPERMARFEREARVLASLNHPNLAAVYDVPEVEGRRYLTMEYIEGESLAERLRRNGALSLSETIEICHQIAAGMEAAHEGGVIHRDLKPENVMITGAERVKVVDFGLAKGRLDDPEPVRGHAVSPVFTSSPTVTSPAETMPGIILGTAPYLSPEQARGKIVDRRTDIWAFGCIVHECLTGQKLFRGGSVQDTIAAILERPMDWRDLPKETPPRIRELLDRCLERDPRKRLRDIGEAGLMLEGARASATAAATTPTIPLWRRLVPLLGAIGAIALGLRLFGPAILARLRGPSEPVRRVSVEIPRNLQAVYWTITPDGSTLLVKARPSSSSGADAWNFSVYRRSLDRPDFELIPGTEHVGGFGLSPDGSTFLMLAGSPNDPRMVLKRASVDGSSPTVELMTWNPAWSPGAPLASGRLLVTLDTDQWASLNPDDGTIGKPISFDIPGQRSDISFGDVLPGDRGVLLNLGSSGERSVGILDLRTNQSKRLLPNAGFAVYDPEGRLLFVRQGTLYAVPFDMQRLEVHGTPVPLVDRLDISSTWTGDPVMAYTRDGTLAYRAGTTGEELRTVVSVSPKGSVTAWSPLRRPFGDLPMLSPDGSRMSCSVDGQDGSRELWILERGRPSADLVSNGDGGTMVTSVWSPDGSRLAFGVYGGPRDGVYIKDVIHDAPPVFVAGHQRPAWRIAPTGWAPDGTTLFLTTGSASTVDIEFLSLRPSAPPEIKPLLTEAWFEMFPVVSPDGTWLAYGSTQTGRGEVRIRPLSPGPSLGKATQVSTDGGYKPVWSRRGDALYFESPDLHVMRVGLRTRPTLSVSLPRPVWDLQALGIVGGGWDLAADGSLVGIQKAKDEGDLRRVDLVLHFDREMDTKMKSTRR